MHKAYRWRWMWLGGMWCGFLLAFGAQEAAAESLAEESLRWLREYIQIDTSNPPGREKEAAEYLGDILRREGIEHGLVESAPGRTSVYGRIPGTDPSLGALVLMHHIDVVPAIGQWRQGPFSGRLQAGKLWGRGAVDVKSLGIAQLLVLSRLRRESEALAREVIFLAVADEEAGGGAGAAWILHNKPEILGNIWAVLNEGGSNRVVGGRLAWWGIEVSQKRPLWLRITTQGAAGHASGHHPESASHRLIAALGRLLGRPPVYRASPAAKAYLEAIADLEQSGPRHVFRRLDEVVSSPDPSGQLPVGTGKYFVDTVQVTVLSAGNGINAVPAKATALVDIRLLPDTDDEAFLAEIRQLLGHGVEVEVLVQTPPAPPSPTDHPLFLTLQETLSVRGPVIPTFLAGATDSRFFRQRGIPAYGFSPFAIAGDSLRGIHAEDEHIPAAAFLRGTEMLYRVVRAATR